MKMINSHVKGLKLGNDLILMIPSSPTLHTSLQPKEKQFNQTCVANQLSVYTTAARLQNAQKSKGKVRKKLNKANTSFQNIQKHPES